MGNHGYSDCSVIKLDDKGHIQWSRTIGGSKSDVFSSIKQTNDEGFILVGESDSNDGDIVGNLGSRDACVIKLDSIGNIQWQKSYGGSKIDKFTDILSLNNGSYIFSGFTESSDGEVSFNHGGRDFWIVTIDDTGKIISEKTYGGSNFDSAIDMKPCFDGGFIVIGDTHSGDGDVTNNNYHYGDDFWILKFNSSAILEWSKCYGGSNTELAYEIQQTVDSVVGQFEN